MQLYLAGVGSCVKDMGAWIRENFPDIGVLMSFAQSGQFAKLAQFGFTDIMIDSGAYSAWNSGITIDRQALLDFYLEKEQDPKVKCTVGLDIIGDPKKGWGTVENWEWMRERGSRCIPTYHAGDDEEVLHYYCSRTDFLGFGGAAGQAFSWRQLIPAIEKVYSKYPHHKWHLFGINDPRVTNRFDAYSCDALTWRSGSRFGQVITPFGRWWVSPRNKRRLPNEELEALGVGQWLRDRGLPFPFPLVPVEDDEEGSLLYTPVDLEEQQAVEFDWKELDRSNIQVLWESVAKYERQKDVTFQNSLF